MGVQLNLTDIQSGFLSASGHTSNNTLIEQALNKALDRTANNDNAMEVDLDMGGNSFINVDQINGADVSILTGDITTVADNIASVNTVAGGIADVNSVAGITADVTSVAAVASDVSTVAGVVANLATVATNIANVIAVGDDIASVINVSNNLDAVNNFADLYLGERTVDPIPGGGEAFLMTLDGADANTNPADTAFGTLTITGGVSGDPDPLLVGSLYFNTTGNGGVGELRIWNGTDWVTAAFAADAANGVSYNNGTSGLIATDVQAAIDEVDAAVDLIKDAHDTLVISTGTSTSYSLPSATTNSSLKFTGIPNLDLPVIATFPDQDRIFTVENAYSTEPLIIKSSGGTGITISAGETHRVRYNGSTDWEFVNTEGSRVIDASSGTFTLDPEWPFRDLIITGSPGVDIDIVMPTEFRRYTIHNTMLDGSDLTVKRSGGTGTLLENGKMAEFWYDANDWNIATNLNNASEVIYDNTASGAIATDAQGALDNLYSIFKSQNLTIDSGNFSSDPFTAYIRQTGSDVTITTNAPISHPLNSSASSAVGEIPAEFRPTNTATNIFNFDSTFIGKVSVTAAGQFVLDYVDWAGLGVSKTSTAAQVSITYSLI